jgi:hypothetical protein
VTKDEGKQQQEQQPKEDRNPKTEGYRKGMVVDTNRPTHGTSMVERKQRGYRTVHSIAMLISVPTIWGCVYFGVAGARNNWHPARPSAAG